MNRNKDSYIQLELFSNSSNNTSGNEDIAKEGQTKDRTKNLYKFPKTEKNAHGSSPFELLYLALKQIIGVLELKPKTGLQHATILRNRYLENKKDAETAKLYGKTPERIRQIRIKLISEIMNGKDNHKPGLKPELSAELKSMASRLTAQDPCKVLHSENGTLPFSLLDFVNMTVFKEQDMADSFFIAPNDQVIPLQHHIRELVKLLRSSYTPLEMSFVSDAMPSLLKKRNVAFNEEWLMQIINGHHWIETAGTQLQLRYEGLRYPSLKVARIIYENKRIHKDDIIRIYNERETSDEEKIKGNQISLSVLIKKKDIRFQSQGKSGIWTFHEEIKSPIKSISQVLHEYLEAHDGLINLLEVEQYVQSLEYHYPLHTLRCYLLKECVSSVDDSNLLCRQDCIQHYPETKWRSRLPASRQNCKVPPYYHEIINKVKELLNNAVAHRLPRKDIVKICKAIVPENIENNIVYKIINYKMKDCIVLKHIDGIDYLELK